MFDLNVCVCVHHPQLNAEAPHTALQSCSDTSCLISPQQQFFSSKAESLPPGLDDTACHWMTNEALTPFINNMTTGGFLWIQQEPQRV